MTILLAPIKTLIKFLLPQKFIVWLYQTRQAKLDSEAQTPSAKRQNDNHPQSEERHYYGLNELDRKLENFLDFDGGYFVELGANDGISQSNTRYFEQYRGWTGLLIEPTPHNFLACLQNRAAQTRVFCRACVSFEYKDKFVEIAFSNLMSTPIGLESDIFDQIGHAQTGKQFLRPHEEIFSFGALAAPLNTLLIEAGSPARIDLLSLDVEGAEMEVLKGIDHSTFRFKYICVECRIPDRLTQYLDAIGYLFVEKLSEHDYLFVDSLTNNSSDE
jgi:FkbM family methyltransferase